MCCKCEKARTPFFIPKTAPHTKEGVERLRAEFYNQLKQKGFKFR